MSKSKFVGVALATCMAASFMACGGGEEKETRALPSEWTGLYEMQASDLIIPKSYVRENKSVTPPFIATFSASGAKKQGEDFGERLSILADEQSQKDIIDVKVNNGECKIRYRQGGGMGPMIVMGHWSDEKCDIKQVELTTKAGKVTYKF